MMGRMVNGKCPTAKTSRLWTSAPARNRLPAASLFNLYGMKQVISTRNPKVKIIPPSHRAVGGSPSTSGSPPAGRTIHPWRGCVSSTFRCASDPTRKRRRPARTTAVVAGRTTQFLPVSDGCARNKPTQREGQACVGFLSYSLRSTSTGSTRAAARAGSRHASTATASRIPGTATNVAGSVGVTP